MENYDTLGRFSINIRNRKGEEALNLLRSHKLFTISSVFNHKHKTTWKSFYGKDTKFQLDHWIMSSLKYIQNSKVVNFWTPSDHSVILLKMKILSKKPVIRLMKNFDWNFSLDENFKKDLIHYYRNSWKNLKLTIKKKYHILYIRKY